MIAILAAFAIDFARFASGVCIAPELRFEWVTA
jgi:hypothetical protein